MATSLGLPPQPGNMMPPPPRRISSTPTKTTTSTDQTDTSATDSATEGAAEADTAAEKDDADALDADVDATVTDQTFANIATDDVGDNDSMSGDLERKMFELQASGWRPPEETAETPDDDDYGSVDLLSDTEEEDAHLRKQEESLLTAEEGLSAISDETLARRLSLSSQGSRDSDVAYADFSDDFMFSSETPWSTSIQHLHPDNLLDYSTVFGGGEETPLARKVSQESVETQRRVRFQDELDISEGDSSDSEADDDLYPDLFVPQDQVDPSFLRDIEAAADDHDLYKDDDSDAASCWDFEADEAAMLFDEDSSDSDGSAGSSGYETDDGDTTDEEEIQLPPEKLKKATEKPEMASAASTPAKSNMQIRKAQRAMMAKQSISKPHRGSFVLDPHKPILTVDCETGKPDKIRIWPARKPTGQDKAFWQNVYVIHSTNTSRAASRNTSPRMSVQMTPTEDSDSTMASRGLSMEATDMFSGIFDKEGKLRADQVLGPAEAFYGFMDVNATGSLLQDDFMQDGSQAMSGAEEEKEQDVVNDFVDFGDSDEEMPDESDNLMSPTVGQSFSSANTGSNTGGFDLLAHLDRRRGVVSAFRRNQQIAKHVGSLPSHPALRASASETNAMQTGRRAAANTPITPLRKKKMGKGVGARNSPITSPMTKSPPTKRKGPMKGGFSR